MAMDNSILSNLTMKQLQIFLAAAKHNNITKAAQELYMTQATISRNIETLESIIGLRLFTRTNRGVQLTEEGKQLLIEWQWAIGLFETSIKNAQSSQNAGRPNLLIGDYDSTDNNMYLLPIVKEFEKRNKDVNLKIDKGPPLEIINGVIESKYDAAFISRPYLELFANMDVEITDTLNLPPSLVIAKGNPLFGADDIDPQEVASMPMVAMRQPFVLRWQYVEKVYHECGFEPKEVRFVDNPHVMALELLRRPCVALMDRSYAPIRRDELRYIDLDGCKTRSGFVLVARKRNRQPAILGFIKAARDFSSRQPYAACMAEPKQE